MIFQLQNCLSSDWQLVAGLRSWMMPQVNNRAFNGSSRNTECRIDLPGRTAPESSAISAQLGLAEHPAPCLSTGSFSHARRHVCNVIAFKRGNVQQGFTSLSSQPCRVIASLKAKITSSTPESSKFC
jgi:hypothetical protein